MRKLLHFRIYSFALTDESDYPVLADSDYPILKITRIWLRTLKTLHTGVFRIIRSRMFSDYPILQFPRFRLRTLEALRTDVFRNIRYRSNRIIRYSRIIRS